MDTLAIIWHDIVIQIPETLFKNHRYPASIIQYAVWLYFVFPLSFRDVELLLHQRGIVVSYEAIRTWCYKFGPYFAQHIRQKRRSATDKWHLDEVFVTINGQRYYLWRAVDSEGMVLDILMQTRRNAKAAKRFFEGVLGTTHDATTSNCDRWAAELQYYFPCSGTGCGASS